MADAAELLKLRKRFVDDFPFYAKHALKIRTKEGTVAPLVLNRAQQILWEVVERQLATTGKVRVVILKGRQQGLSTMVGGVLFWRVTQARAQRALIMAHKADSSATLFDMSQRYQDHCPEPLKQKPKYSNRRELNFDKLDSSYLVATAGADSVARGETLQLAHLSEVGFWQPTQAPAIWNGLLQAVPNTPGSMIFVESTANGMAGVFYDIWQGAVAGTNGFEPVFIPWFVQDEYREPVPEGFRLTPEENDIVRKFGLDNEQLQFRRMKIGATSREQFMQEYPCFPDEAFLTSGMPVFNPEQLQEQLKAAPAPLERLSLEGEEWQPNPRGQLFTYAKLQQDENYTIGVDVAMGIRGGDYSVAQVLDSHRRQVAVWRGHVHPDFFARILYALGRRYNYGRIIVERNGHGILTCTRLAKDLAYPNVFMEETVGNLEQDFRDTIGFSTNARTKPLIIDELRAAMREGMTLRDRTTLTEMLRFVVHENGSMAAEEGRDANGEPFHDDCVMSLALANHIHEGPYVPMTGLEDLYVDAI